jgi:hypothetical protein
MPSNLSASTCWRRGVGLRERRRSRDALVADEYSVAEIQLRKI